MNRMLLDIHNDLIATDKNIKQFITAAAGAAEGLAKARVRLKSLRLELGQAVLPLLDEDTIRLLANSIPQPPAPAKETAKPAKDPLQEPYVSDPTGRSSR